MKKFVVSPVVASLFALGGCGSSTDNSPEKEVISPKAEIQTTTLTFNVKRRTKCGLVEYPNASVIFHGEDGKPIATYSSDKEGFFSQEVPEGAKHVSIIGMESYGRNDTTRKIYSKLDIANGAELETIEFEDFSVYCECKDVTVDLSALAVTHSMYSISRLGGGSISNYQDAPEVCGSDAKLYYSINNPGYELNTLAVVDVPQDVNSIVVTGSDFVHQSVNVPTSQFEVKTRVDVYGLDDNGNRILENFEYAAEQVKLKIYPSISSNNKLDNYKSISFAHEGHHVIMSSGVRAQLDEMGQVTGFKLPEASTELAGQLSSAVTALEQEQTMAYDFTDLDARIQTASWQFYIEGTESIKWNIAGSVKSVLPKLTFGDVVSLPTQKVSYRSHLLLSGYDGAPSDIEGYRGYVYKNLDKSNQSDYAFIFLSSRTTGEPIL
ncbi:hypothetical protein [Pseudoalteromonas luteoviolacea]|uniref:hypothetical protein n=1 Tax=Pseudoalteromonas luteoviolacea TaxID=43657 RepID=UPI001B36E330|nr:hypothetical protein [Pseudoalteromonas luteoviolacea]MBQ4839602.1 hypothetical protein [Pseudoalteromonas luteoviolacea]